MNNNDQDLLSYGGDNVAEKYTEPSFDSSTNDQDLLSYGTPDVPEAEESVEDNPTVDPDINKPDPGLSLEEIRERQGVHATGIDWYDKTAFYTGQWITNVVNTAASSTFEGIAGIVDGSVFDNISGEVNPLALIKSLEDVENNAEEKTDVGKILNNKLRKFKQAAFQLSEATGIDLLGNRSVDLRSKKKKLADNVRQNFLDSDIDLTSGDVTYEEAVNKVLYEDSPITNTVSNALRSGANWFKDNRANAVALAEADTGVKKGWKAFLDPKYLYDVSPDVVGSVLSFGVGGKALGSAGKLLGKGLTKAARVVDKVVPDNIKRFESTLAPVFGNETLHAVGNAVGLTAIEADMIGHQSALTVFEDTQNELSDGEYSKLQNVYAEEAAKGVPAADAGGAYQKAAREFRNSWINSEENAENAKEGLIRAATAHEIGSKINMANAVLNLSMGFRNIGARINSKMNHLPSKLPAVRKFQKKTAKLSKGIDDYIKSDANIVGRSAAKIARSVKRNLIPVAFEAGQEYVEEGIINVAAEKLAVNLAMGKEYTSSDLFEDITSKEAVAQGLIGLVSGGGTAAFVNMLNTETNEKDEQDAKIKNQIRTLPINKSQDYSSVVSNIFDITEKDDYHQGYVNSILESGLDIEANSAQKMVIGEQALSAIKHNAFPELISYYRDIEQSLETTEEKQHVTDIIEELKTSRDQYNKVKSLPNSYTAYRNRMMKDYTDDALSKVTHEKGLIYESLRNEFNTYNSDPSITFMDVFNNNNSNTEHKQDFEEIKDVIYANPALEEYIDYGIRENMLRNSGLALEKYYQKTTSRKGRAEAYHKNRYIRETADVKLPKNTTVDERLKVLDKITKKYKGLIDPDNLKLFKEMIAAKIQPPTNTVAEALIKKIEEEPTPIVEEEESTIPESIENETVDTSPVELEDNTPAPVAAEPNTIEQIDPNTTEETVVLKPIETTNEKFPDQDISELEALENQLNFFGEDPASEEAPESESGPDSTANIEPVSEAENITPEIVEGTVLQAAEVAPNSVPSIDLNKVSAINNVEFVLYGWGKSRAYRAAHQKFQQYINNPNNLLVDKVLNYEIAFDYITMFNDESAIGKPTLIPQSLKAKLSPENRHKIKSLKDFTASEIDYMVNLPVKAKLAEDSFSLLNDRNSLGASFNTMSFNSLSQVIEIENYIRAKKLAVLENWIANKSDYQESILGKTAGIPNIVTNPKKRRPPQSPNVIFGNNKQYYTVRRNDIANTDTPGDQRIPLPAKSNLSPGALVVNLTMADGTDKYIPMLLRDELTIHEKELFHKAITLNQSSPDSKAEILSDDGKTVLSNNISPREIIKLFAYPIKNTATLTPKVINTLKPTHDFSHLNSKLSSIVSSNFNLLGRDYRTGDNYNDFLFEGSPLRPSMYTTNLESDQAINSYLITGTKKDVTKPVIEQSKDAEEAYLESLYSSTDTTTVADPESNTKQLEVLKSILPKDISINLVEKVWQLANNKVGLARTFLSLETLTPTIEYTGLATADRPGTLYHEAFHVISQYVLNPREYKQLLDETRKHYPQATNEQLEEILAEDFRRFMLDGRQAVKPMRRTYFQILKDMVLNFLGFNNRSRRDVLFRKISDGEYSNTIDLNKVPNLGPLFSSVETTDMLDITPLLAKKYANFLLSKVINTLNIYQTSYNIDNATLVKALKESAEKHPVDYIKNNLNELATKAESNANNILLREVNSLISNITGRLDAKLVIEEKETFTKFDANSYESRPDLKASAYTKLILATIPKYDNFNEVVLDKDTGLAVMEDFAATYNFLLGNLTDIYSTDNSSDLVKFYNKLSDLGAYKPSIAFLSKKLDVLALREGANEKDIKSTVYSAFNLAKRNFKEIKITTNRGKVSETTLLDSSDNNKIKLVMSNWSNSRPTDEAAKRLYKNLKKGVNKKYATEEIAIETLTKVLNTAGIDVSINTVKYYLDKKVKTSAERYMNRFLLRSKNWNKETGQIKMQNFDKLALAESELNAAYFDTFFLGADNKPIYGYGYKTHLDNVLNRFKTGERIAFLKDKIYHKGSKFIQKAANNSKFFDAINVVDASALKVDKGNRVAFKDLDPTDALVANINLFFNSKKSDQFTSIARLLSFEAKSRSDVYLEIPGSMIQTETFQMIDNEYHSIPDTYVDLFYDYYFDEIERYLEFTRNPVDLINLQSNHKKSFLFPETTNPKTNDVIAKGIQDAIFTENTELQEAYLELLDKGTLKDFISKNTRIKEYINSNLLDYLNKELKQALKLGIIDKKGNSNFITTGRYTEAGLKNATGVYANYILGNMGMGIEFSKLFYSDPANFKVKKAGVFIDFAKRTPFLSASGISTMELPYVNKDDKSIPPDYPDFRVQILPENILDYNIYNEAYITKHVIPNAEQQLIQSKAEKGQPNYELTAKDKKQIRKKVEHLFSGYKHTDNSDAQGYITLDRWRQILRTTNKWNDATAKLYNKAKEGTETLEDMIEANNSFQNIKGQVSSDQSYGKFNTNVYLKYSQGVLLPSMTKSFPELEALRLAMEIKDPSGRNMVDEAVYQTGSKISNLTAREHEGRFDPTRTLTLSNLDYRIATDGTAKYHKKEYDSIKTQVSKSLISALNLSKEYTIGAKKEKVTGAKLIKFIDKAFSILTARQGDTFSNAIDKDHISQLGALADLNPEQLELLNRGVDMDFLPNRTKIVQSVASNNRKNILGIDFRGGAFIQFAPDKANKAVRKLKEGESLSSAFIFDGYDSLSGTHHTEDGAFKPSKVLMPYSFIKSVPGLQDYSMEELKSLLLNTSKANRAEIFKGISYRVPTQGPSSIDVFEIAGILPDSMGDTIIVANEGTTKFGFDFDYDKLYTLLPEIKLNDEGTGLQKIKYPKDIAQSKLSNKQLKNLILDTYTDIVQEEHYQFTLSLDGLTTEITNFINTYHDLEIPNDITFFSPISQLTIKKNNLNAKVALTGIAAVDNTDNIRNRAAGLQLSGEIEGYGTSISDQYDTNDNPITDFKNALLSLSIDVANFPGIIQAGVNKHTINVVKLLSDLGVPPMDILTFIGQPVIKQYSELKDLDSLQVSKGSPVFTKDGRIQNADYIMEKLLGTAEPNKNIASLMKESKVLKDRLLKYKEDKELGFDILDSKIFNTYKGLEEVAKQLQAATKASRVDTAGMGRSFTDAYLTRERIRRVLGISVADMVKFDDYIINPNTAGVSNPDRLFNTNADIKNFYKKFSNTHLGASYVNSVLRSYEDFDGITFEADPDFVKFLDYAVEEFYGNKQVGGKPIMPSEKFISALTNTYYTYMINNFDINLRQMFYGPTSVARRYIDLKNSNEGFAATRFSRILNTDLTNGVDKFISDTDTADFVYMNNFMKLSDMLIAEVKQEWTDMMNGVYDTEGDTSVSEFAESLVYYNFAISGFNFATISSLQQFMPDSVALALNKNEINSRDWSRILDQTVKNNVDKDFVPNISDKNKLNIDGKLFNKNFGFRTTAKYSAFYKDKNSRLYAHHSTIKNPLGKDEQIYIRTNKLGLDQNFRQIVEIGPEIESSSLSFNQVGIDKEYLAYNENNDIRDVSLAEANTSPSALDPVQTTPLDAKEMEALDNNITKRICKD